MPLSALARGLEAHNGRLLFINWSQPRRQLAEMEGAATRTKSAHIRQCRREVQWGQVFTCLSPLGPLTFPLTDLAGRHGPRQ